MSTVTIRPDSTISATASAHPSGTIHGVLADDSDGTYAQLTGYLAGSSLHVAFADPSPPSGTLERVSVRVRAVSTLAVLGVIGLGGITVRSRLYDGSTLLGTWLTTVTWASPQTVTVGSVTAADVSTDNLTLELSWSAGGLIVSEAGVQAVYLDLEYVADPSVTVTAPTGMVATNQPVVEWVPNGPQAAWEAKIFSDTIASGGGFDADTSPAEAASGVVNTAAVSWLTPTLLSSGTWDAFVRVALNIGGVRAWSDWASSSFTGAFDPPASPEVVLTIESPYGRIRVDVAAAAGTPATDAIEIQALVDGAWTALRNQQSEAGVLSGDVVFALDYEASNGLLSQYRARALAEIADGVFAASEWVEAQATWSSQDWWLKDVARPDLNVRLRVGELDMCSYPDTHSQARQGIVQGLGATSVIVASDTRTPDTGTIVVQPRSTPRHDDIVRLLAGLRPVLLQGPASDGHPARYVVFGNHDSVRVVDKAWAHITRDTLPWTQVPRPTGLQITLGRVNKQWVTSWAVDPTHVNKQWQTSWTTHAHVARAWVTSWATRIPIAKSWRTSWTTHQHVARAWLTSWATRIPIAKSWRTSWTTHQHVARQWTTGWTTSEHAAKQWMTSWGVGQTHVDKAWATSWVTHAHVAKQWLTSWMTHAHVARAWVTAWVTHEHVAKQWVTDWMVEAGPTFEGPLSPATLSNVSNDGTAWGSPGNAAASDNTYATATVTYDASDFLRATNFGFAIPAGATIEGIIVDVELKANVTGNIYDSAVKLVIANAIVGTDKKRAPGSTWPTSDTYVTYGSASDLWGTSPTRADINASNFGVAIAARNDDYFTTKVASIDHIRITVHYTP